MTRKVSSILVCDVHDIRTGGLTQRQDYDLRNDQALPNLQAATKQASTNGDRALRLRQTCLAGIAPRVRASLGSLASARFSRRSSLSIRETRSGKEAWVDGE